MSATYLDKGQRQETTRIRKQRVQQAREAYLTATMSAESSEAIHLGPIRCGRPISFDAQVVGRQPASEDALRLRATHLVRLLSQLCVNILATFLASSFLASTWSRHALSVYARERFDNLTLASQDAHWWRPVRCQRCISASGIFVYR